MAQETIRNIREAELKAQQTVKDAEAEKIAILNKAKEEGAAYKADLTQRASEAAQKAVQAVESTRDAVMADAEKRAEEVINYFTVGAKEKREQAIQAVIAEIS